jgi:ABC-type nitrate/sulfonate/bicarbonate transport system permease component
VSRDPDRGVVVPWLGRAVLPVAGLVVVLGLFEVASRTDVLPHGSFPPVSQIFTALGRVVVTVEFRTVVGLTLQAWALAMLIAVVLAVPLGLVIGSTRVGFLLTRVTLDFLRPIPSVALIPLLVLIYGTRPSLKITLAVIGAFFPLLFQAMYAVRDVDPVAQDTARSFGLSRRQRVRRVVMPSCLPYLLTGLRISSSIALILVVTGEYILNIDGIGKAVFQAQSAANYEQMYAYVVAAGLLGVILNALFQTGERYLLFWHPSHRPAAT